MSHLSIIRRHEDLRTVALARLRAPHQMELYAACALCGSDIFDFRQEQRLAGPDGPVLCTSCAEDAERRMAKAIPMVAGIERMTAPHGEHSVDSLTGSVLGYCAKRQGAALTLYERIVLQIAAYRHWQATHSRRAA